jgi:hypothetical protein
MRGTLSRTRVRVSELYTDRLDRVLRADLNRLRDRRALREVVAAPVKD